MVRTAIVTAASSACAEVFRGTSVFLAYAYGSRVEGGATPDSDLDIGYYLANPGALPIAEELLLADRLSRRLGVEVDLRNLGQAPLEWRARVFRQVRPQQAVDHAGRIPPETGVGVVALEGN